MDVRNTAAESARICHELLVRQGKGLSYCTVLAVLPDMESDVILKTDKKLPSADGIVLEIFVHKNGALNILEFSGEHFQVLENASRHKALRLRLISEEIRKAFSDPDIRGVRIRSDLRFLVKRVQKWYEKYGAEVALPHPAVLSGEDMPDISLRPSPEQEKAIRTALTFPFTYIWGAPGTGKTRMVLASCVISCLKRGERVLVAAPTNNALEQTLFGLFPALEREGITLSGSAVRHIIMSMTVKKRSSARTCAPGTAMRIIRRIAMIRSSSSVIWARNFSSWDICSGSPLSCCGRVSTSPPPRSLC